MNTLKLTTYIRIAAVMALLAIIWGCGSGDGSGSIKAGNTTVTVSKAALGKVSGAVKGIELTLVLPDKVTVKTDASGTPLVSSLWPNDVTNANGSLVARYTSASGGTPGKVKIAIIRGNNPFEPGDLFNVTCEAAAGIKPTVGQFSIEGLKVYDQNGVEMSGATAEVSEVIVL